MDSNSLSHVRSIAGLGGRTNAIQSRQKAIATYHAAPNHCAECGVPILVRGKETVTVVRKKRYCTRSCANRWNNRKHPKRPCEGRCRTCSTPVPKAWTYCEPCRATRPKPPPRGIGRRQPNATSCYACGTKYVGKRRYCSERCRPSGKLAAAALRAAYVEAWRAGDVTGMRHGHQISGHVRSYLLEKHDSRCSSCGWAERNPVTGRVPLHIDHIDGDWQNNREENLRPLCPNCHSLTPTYGSLNRGRGRPDRRTKRHQAV